VITKSLAKIFLGIFFFSLVIISCTKVNSPTELGSGLIPAVDDITTFERLLAADVDNKLFSDTAKLFYGDNIGIGHLNDPVFGTSEAEGYMSLSSQIYGKYPFINRDSVTVDSVVLSLSYKGTYGDSLQSQTVEVREISQMANFKDTVGYTFANLAPFATVGGLLGSRSFSISSLKDTISVVTKRDTARVANVLRIHLNKSLGNRFVGYDTTSTANGGFKNDSIFKSLFRGIQIKEVSKANVISYFSPSDLAKTQLTVYFKVTKNGVLDTLAASFAHITGGQANRVVRSNGSAYATTLGNASSNDSKVYIQSTPGSYGAVKIPGLDTFRNSVIHLAELIFPADPSASEATYYKPAVLYLDRVNTARDTAYTFGTDIDYEFPSNASAIYSPLQFGGVLTNGHYKFNITRYVQGIVTLKEPNQTLRVYAPLRGEPYFPLAASKLSIQVLQNVAQGRVVLLGGNPVNIPQGARLRIVYSRL